MTTDPPLLSILIVNWNGMAHLPECLESLASQDFRDFEVVMVDNASKDGSVAWLRENHPKVRIVQASANLGFAGGNNFGLPHCRGKYVFLLNNDTRTEPGALGRLAEALAGNPAVRVFACFLLNHSNPALVDSAGDTLYLAGATFSYARYPAALFPAPREVASACAGAAVYERALLQDLGGFDEDFFLIFEDTDLSFRARHRGETILFLPQVRILHKGSATLGKGLSPTALYYSGRNLPLLFLKDYPLLTLCKTMPGITFISLLRLIQAARQGKAGIVFRSWYHALKLFPAMLRKRRAIMSGSKLTRADFERHLRRGFLREWLGAKRSGFGYPL